MDPPAVDPTESPAPSRPEVGALLKQTVLVASLLVAAHLVWCGLTGARTLLALSGARAIFAHPGFDRAALITHVRAAWLAVAVVLNAAFLLWRGFRLAGPAQVAAGAVLLYLYFADVQWRLWLGAFPGCLAIPLVAALGVIQMVGPLSPVWPRPSADRGPGVMDLAGIFFLSLLPWYLGTLVLDSVRIELARSLEEDPTAILQLLDAPEALERAEALSRLRPDAARSIAEALTRHAEEPVRERAWRLLAEPSLGVPAADLARGLERETAPPVRLALFQVLRARREPEAAAAFERAAQGQSGDRLATLVQVLAGSEPDLHAALRRTLAARLGTDWLAGRASDATLRLALARAGDPEIQGMREALESAPADAFAPGSPVERTVRWLWRTAAHRGAEAARSGLPEPGPLPVRLQALLIGDLVPIVGTARFADRVRGLARLLRDGSPPERYAAGFALYRLKPTEAAKALTLAIGDAEPDVRMWAAMALTEMGGTPPGGVFEEFFHDEKSPHRFDAAVFLLRYGRDHSVVPYLLDQVGGPAGPMTRGVLEQAFGQDLGPDPRPWRDWWQERTKK